MRRGLIFNNWKIQSWPLFLFNPLFDRTEIFLGLRVADCLLQSSSLDLLKGRVKVTDSHFLANSAPFGLLLNGVWGYVCAKNCSVLGVVAGFLSMH